MRRIADNAEPLLHRSIRHGHPPRPPARRPGPAAPGSVPAVVTRESVANLGLAVGLRACAAVMVSRVILAMREWRPATRMHPTPRPARSAWLAAAATLAALLLAPAAQAGAVRVAVATNFAGPLAKIAEGFTAATGHALKTSAGPTGKFYSQILHGAPFDVLLAADSATPKRLVAEGHAVAGSNFTYAIGVLVLWSAQPGLVDDQGAVLASGRFSNLAIANPKLAPYGAAALQVIAARDLAEAITPRLVTAESIAQAYQFVFTGNAELGFVALSQVAVPGKPAPGSYWRVPATLYGEIRQDAVLLKHGEKNAAAAALLAYLKTPAAKAVMQAYGYGS